MRYLPTTSVNTEEAPPCKGENMPRNHQLVAKKKRGVTLIMVAGVLAVLAALATGFYFMMLSQTKSAVRYQDFVRADVMARAGINYGIAQMRAQAYEKTEDAGDAWHQVDYLRGARKRASFQTSPLRYDGVDNDADGKIDNPEEAFVAPDKMLSYSMAMGSSAGKDSDRFTLNVSDAGGKINVNAGDNLAVMLDNLCRAIGPPLVAAQADALQPRRWSIEADPGDPIVAQYANDLNKNDLPDKKDIYYALTDEAGKVSTTEKGRPMRGTDGNATYGDGYAIAGYRSRHGAFKNLEDIKKALTYVERNGNDIPDDRMEQLEIDVKFAAISDHLTISSWVDTNTVCVGKFEWIHINTGASNKTIAIDRDKSWVADDLVNDPLNNRGSLRGCYLSIMNGHGAGQLRRIRTNGIDWVEVENGFTVTPGPISSYMIIAPEEAKLMEDDGTPSKYNYADNLPPEDKKVRFPMTNPDGTFVREPKMDYSLRPLCIHRAPVNINTATDKVLVALFLGINVQHGHTLAVGTDADVLLLQQKWLTNDIRKVQPYILTPAGLKRIPAASGKVILNRSWGTGKNQTPLPPPVYDFAYLNNYNQLNSPNFTVGSSDPGLMTEAHELAYRVMMVRQTDRGQPALKYVDPKTGGPTAADTGLLRGPFRTWDDIYFRVVKPWDEIRFKNGWTDKNGDGVPDGGDEFHNARLSNLIMAHFNSNTDIMKFNPNIEWIDRWSRNFTEQEPVMVYTNEAAAPKDGYTTDVSAADPIAATSSPIYTRMVDTQAWGWAGKPPPLKSSQKDIGGAYIPGAYITRNFRYKSDEMIDKTDLNRSTTEFSFDSNGVFEIVSTGQVAKSREVLAERKLVALVKIYDVWRESTQQQFVMGTISDAKGDILYRGDPKEMKKHLSSTGQYTRDASGSKLRKGLVTLPEPLMPLTARIVDHNGNPNPRNAEVVTSIDTKYREDKPLDAFGRERANIYDSGAKPIEVPEVLANHVLPSRYDGQIVLATNTTSYDETTGGDRDTFLASFDGDLDTATCKGNGREQAKWPYSAKPDGSGSFQYTGEGHLHRCVQSIGLLGLLNDELVASDPGIPLVDGKTPFNDMADAKKVRWVYPFIGVSSCLMPLKLGADPERPMYWNNVTVRMGSLRTDGAYLSSPGVSGNNATLKYLYSPDTNRENKLNFQPDSQDGNCITMWAKTTWHQDDMRNHEFFNPGNECRIWSCVGFNLQKTGQYKWTAADESRSIGHCGNRRDLNDLFSIMEYEDGSGHSSALHGGYAGVLAKNSPDESPGYRVQPFRWSFVGLRTRYPAASPTYTAAGEAIGPRGHLVTAPDYNSTFLSDLNQAYLRPVIDTQLYGEELDTWKGKNALGLKLRWGYCGYQPWGRDPKYHVGRSRDVFGGPTSKAEPNPTANNIRQGEGQDAKWVWADPYGFLPLDPKSPGGAYSLKSFGMNNLNFGNPAYNQVFTPSGAGGGTSDILWHYRYMPEDGTYAVIDEFKISSKDRVLKSGDAGWPEDRVSRDMTTSRYYLPRNPGGRGDPAADGPPTFTSQTLLQSLKGFDKLKNGQPVSLIRVSWNVFTPRFMCEYQLPSDSPFERNERLTNNTGPTAPQAQVPVKFKGPFDAVKYNDDDDTSYYSVDRPAPWVYKTGGSQSGRGVEVELLEDTKLLDSKTFTDPSAINSLGTTAAPVIADCSRLHYRVRFVYPVDPLVDPTVATKDAQGRPCIDPDKQYLLDTPVFDDISVTYMLSPRILSFREVVE